MSQGLDAKLCLLQLLSEAPALFFCHAAASAGAVVFVVDKKLFSEKGIFPLQLGHLLAEEMHPGIRHKKLSPLVVVLDFF